MRIVSPLLKHVVYPGLGKTGHLRWRRGTAPAVLTYHGLLPPGYCARDTVLDEHLITADTFRTQLRLLKSKYNVISPEEFRLWCDSEVTLPPRSVLLTCDDGLLNTITDMLPIVREFNVPFLFFVTGASTSEQRSMLWYEQLYMWLLQGGENVSLHMPWREQPYVAKTIPQKRSLWQQLLKKLSTFDRAAREAALDGVRIQIGISETWLAEYSQNEPSRRRFFMLNRSELQELADAGMTIGAHTLSHPMLSQMSEPLAWREISESRTELAKALGREVWAFAFPFGTPEAVHGRDAELAQRAGFTCAFMNMEGSLAHDKFQLPRSHVSAGMGLAELEAHLCGLHRSLHEKYAAAVGRSIA
jgi:peptidoglycan/xylan/chitin deacetylase (PgdA/CDA1 family)